LAEGETNAEKLAALVTTKIKRKDEAKKALTNCFKKQHVFLIRELMDQYHYLNRKIVATENELFDLSRPYHHLIEKLKEIPGFSDVLAIGVIAEATDQMDHFQDERKFAAWAGVASGNNESAGKKKDRNADRAILI
jgi:transposase